jgi:hypothetical protein
VELLGGSPPPHPVRNAPPSCCSSQCAPVVGFCASLSAFVVRMCFVVRVGVDMLRSVRPCACMCLPVCVSLAPCVPLLLRGSAGDSKQAPPPGASPTSPPKASLGLAHASFEMFDGTGTVDGIMFSGMRIPRGVRVGVWCVQRGPRSYHLCVA